MIICMIKKIYLLCDFNVCRILKTQNFYCRFSFKTFDILTKYHSYYILLHQLKYLFSTYIQKFVIVHHLEFKK